MNAIAQFNQLGGKTVSREYLISLKELAYLEGSDEIIIRIDNILNKFPEGTEFDLEVEKPVIEIGLGAAQHSGLYREALDDCGRLNKGYKFENGFVVKVSTGQADKKKFKKVVAKEVKKPKKSASNYGKKRPFTKREKVITLNTPEKKVIKIARNVIKDILEKRVDKDVIYRLQVENQEKTKLFDKFSYDKKYIDISDSEIDLYFDAFNEKQFMSVYDSDSQEQFEKIYGVELEKLNGLWRILQNPNIFYPSRKEVEKPTRTPKKPTKNERVSIKDKDIVVGKIFLLPNDETITVNRLFIENTDENWVETTRNNKKEENSVKSLRIFLNNWKAIEIDKPTRTPKKATNYGKKRDYESVTSKYTFSKDDIPYQTAYNAHSGTSFSPEKRAVQEQNEYFQHLEHVFKTNRKKAVELGKLDEFETKFARYKEGYLKRFLEHVRSKIGFFSTMIAGPANFPVRRMEKKSNAINAKLNALIDYQKYADFFKPESTIIKTGSETALSKLEAKLQTAEENHARMLAGNKLLKKLRVDKNATENDYKDAFINLGFDLATAKKEANYMFKYEYAGFFTANSSAKIRTIKSQIALEKRLKEKAVVSAENPTEITFEGGSIENDYTDNRIKVFFDSIPDVEIRSFLKKAGQAFKWSPKNKAWQRQLNTYYSGNRTDLYKFLGVTEPEPTKKKVVEPKNNAKKPLPMEVKNNAKSANIQVLDLKEITLDTKRFQNRSKLNENIVNNIVSNFSETELDPLIVWKQKSKIFLLAGHHRYEGLTRLKKKTAPVKYFEGTEKQAIEFAKVKSNANRSLETPIERAKIYREMRSDLSKKEIEEKAKAIEGKNASTILNLSFLNPSGIVIESLQKISSGDQQNKSTLSTVADWIGDARRTYTELTHTHEKEMFDYLMDKEASKRITTKADFKHKIYSLVGTLDFDDTRPLNLKRFKYTTEGEKVYQEEENQLKSLLFEVTEQKTNLIGRLSDPTRLDFIPEHDEAANKIATTKLHEFNLKISKYQKDLIELSRNKGKYTAASNQPGLFGTMPEVISFAVPEIQKEPILYVPTVVPAQEKILAPKTQSKTANKLMQMQFDSLEMDEGWENLLQNPAKNMKIAIWGKPKNGKTSAALQLANYLTKFGSVIYNFADQGFSKSTQDLWIDSGLVNKPNATPSDLTTSKDLEKELKTGNYTFCFIDMISDWIRMEKMTPQEFKERFMRQFPEISFILIMEVTKTGDFKGDQGWTHLPDAIMTVENFLIENRGRYGMGEKIVWEEGFKKFNPKRYAEFMENSTPEETEEEVLFSEEIEKI